MAAVPDSNLLTSIDLVSYLRPLAWASIILRKRGVMTYPVAF